MRLRRSARWALYSARGTMADGSILRGGMRLLHQSVRARQDLDRVVGPERLGLFLAGGDFHHLHEMLGGQRTFRSDVAGVVLEGRLRGRRSDLDRYVEVLGSCAPDAAMTAATLDHRYPGLRDE